MDKTLSLIIPTYNMEQFLQKCLESLIVDDNLMAILEVLVINDGSKDASSEIAHKYESHYPYTFRVIDKENGNYGSCVNKGLKEAKGKYIKILDADDYFDTKAFSDYIRMLSKLEVDLVLSDFEIVDHEGKVIKPIKYTKFKKNRVMEFNKELARADIWMHAVTYRTENLRVMQYKQTEGISYTDQEWIFMPMTTVNSFYYFSQSLYYYVVGRTGQTVAKDVYAKSFAQEVKGLMVMSETYCNTDIMKYPKWTREYLKGRLLYRCNVVYSSYLLLLRKYLDVSELKKIDVTLKKKYRPIYNLSTSHGYSIFKYHYIRDWRTSGYQDTAKLKLYRLYITLRQS